MSISRVLALNFAASLFLPDSSSMSFKTLFKSSKDESESPETTRFKKLTE